MERVIGFCLLLFVCFQPFKQLNVLTGREKHLNKCCIHCKAMIEMLALCKRGEKTNDEICFILFF